MSSESETAVELVAEIQEETVVDVADFGIVAEIQEVAAGIVAEETAAGLVAELANRSAIGLGFVAVGCT